MTPRKALFLLVTAPLLAQPIPDCTYTLQHAPGGSIIVHRNGTALQESDYTRSGANGLRTVVPNGWNDGDLMMFYYSYGTGINVPGTTPPSKITIYLPTKEYKTCTGTQNPPPAPPFVPYTGALLDVNLGTHILTAASITTGTPGAPSRIWLTAGPAPLDTTDDKGMIRDAVVYLDMADQNVKVLRKDGSMAPLAELTRQACQGSGTRTVAFGVEGCNIQPSCTYTWNCAGVELWTLTPPTGTPASYAATPATPELIALPVCPASGACLQAIP